LDIKNSHLFRLPDGDIDFDDDNTHEPRTNGANNGGNNINLATVNIQEAKKNLDKPLLRRKSDLPTDILTQKSLETYQRADEYLTTPGSDAQNDA